MQCDLRFDLFFSFSFVLVFIIFRFSLSSANKQRISKPADEDVLMICLNTIHR